jgi:hypothetical protein
MRAGNLLLRLALPGILACSALAVAHAQSSRRAGTDGGEFGPNVQAYLGYLRNEQEVVDDRASRREIKRSYYIHNLNRINALRQMALQIARATENDYLPELEAVSQNELDQLFDDPLPKPSDFKVGELFEYKLRFLGTILSRGEKFYLFARLDPYEQTELRKKAETKAQTGAQPNGHTATPQPATNAAGARPRRVSIP